MPQPEREISQFESLNAVESYFIFTSIGKNKEANET